MRETLTRTSSQIVALAAAVVVVFALTFLVMPTHVDALPPNGTYTMYFDAYGTQIGEDGITCWGETYSWGETENFYSYEVDRREC